LKRYRLAVCKGPDCRANGSDAVFDKARAVGPSNCHIYRGGCYGLCHLGPNVVLREDTGQKPDPFSREDFQLMGTQTETYYWRMTPEKIVTVLERHVAAGERQTDMVGDPALEAKLRNKT
jgi:(2Fe-2S) ferredoxin